MNEMAHTRLVMVLFFLLYYIVGKIFNILYVNPNFELLLHIRILHKVLRDARKEIKSRGRRCNKSWQGI